MSLPVLRTGDLAYLDSALDGIIPCRVIKIDPKMIHAVVTADRFGYQQGEKVDCGNFGGASDIVPRSVVTFKGATESTADIGNFLVQVDK